MAPFTRTRRVWAGWLTAAVAVAFSFFRLAVIMQGVAARLARGQASSASAASVAALFPFMGNLAFDSLVQHGLRSA